MFWRKTRSCIMAQRNAVHRNAKPEGNMLRRRGAFKTVPCCSKLRLPLVAQMKSSRVPSVLNLGCRGGGGATLRVLGRQLPPPPPHQGASGQQ